LSSGTHSIDCAVNVARMIDEAVIFQNLDSYDLKLFHRSYILDVWSQKQI